MKIGRHIIFCGAHSMATNTSMSLSQGQFMRGLGTCFLLASVVSAPHDFKCLAFFLTGFAYAV